MLSNIGHAAERVAPVVIDVTSALALSNAEDVSLAGAGVAFASGPAGLVRSPAAAANRRRESVAPVQGGLIFLHTRLGETSDVANLGEPLGVAVRMVSLALAGGYRDGAGGAFAAGSGYKLGDTWVGVSEGHLSAAASLLDGHVIVGAGPRLLGVRLTTGGEAHDYLGMGGEAGVIVTNVADAWNFGLSIRSGVTAGPSGGVYGPVAAAKLAPELAAGIGWSNLESLPEGAGTPVRLVLDVICQGEVPGAVALEALVQGEEVARGGWYTASPRLGAEVDIWPDRLRLRAGGYLEPSRTALVGARPHATGGLELRLFRIRALSERVDLDLAWQIGVDYAPRYFRGAWLGINVWQGGQVGGNYRGSSG